jgi:hypothetical protein
MSLNVKIKIDDKITPSCQKKLKQLDAVPDDVYNFWKAHTPVRTGRARRNTFLKKDEIIAAYPYAQRLDDGYSNQAPDGMSKPTEAYFKRRIDAILGKK